MKAVKEPTGSVTLYPFLPPEAPEQAEHKQAYVAIYPPKYDNEAAMVKVVISPFVMSVSDARDLAEALCKAADIAEGLAGRETA